jgi:hypothetical protein
MSIVDGIETCLSNVEFILSQNREARDDDLLLYFTYLERTTTLGYSFFNLGINSLKDLHKEIKMLNIPSYESVSRARRKIQEEGRWIGTKRAARLGEAKAVSDWAVNN